MNFNSDWIFEAVWNAFTESQKLDIHESNNSRHISRLTQLKSEFHRDPENIPLLLFSLLGKTTDDFWNRRNKTNKGEKKVDSSCFLCLSILYILKWKVISRIFSNSGNVERCITKGERILSLLLERFILLYACVNASSYKKSKFAYNV